MGKWEKKIKPFLELCLRLYVMDRLNVKDKEFRNFYNKISIDQFSQNFDKQFPLIVVDASEDLKIAL